VTEADGFDNAPGTRVLDEKNKPREVWSWALYDWGNSAFATSVMGVFFPAMFKLYWNGEEVPATESTFRLGLVSSIASILIVFLAPVLGAIADRGGAKKKFLAFFAFLGVVTTGALVLIGYGQWFPAAIVYGLSLIGFMGANTFYDSLLPGIASEERVDFVSGLGYSLGYLGGGILLVVHGAWLLPSYESLGFANKGTASLAAIGSVAVWWAIFTIPVLLFVHEPAGAGLKKGESVIKSGFVQLKNTFHEIRRLKHTAIFLCAYWLYIDGVDTVIRMATDYGLSLGFSQEGLIQAFIVTQFVGFPAAIAFGKLGEKIGPLIGIYIGIVAYIGICIFGYFVQHEWQFYIVAVMVGLVQGGIQSLSRSMYTRLIPPSKAAEFFGFYNMIGKFAAVIGPLLMGVVGLVTGSTRLSIVSIIVLFVAGGFLLRYVNLEEGQRNARDLDDEL
jgi:UMF1 family MFS transporter